MQDPCCEPHVVASGRRHQVQRFRPGADGHDGVGYVDRRILWPEQVAESDHAVQMVQNIEAVVDEVRQAKLASMLRLLRTLQAEAQVISRNARPFEKAVMGQP